MRLRPSMRENHRYILARVVSERDHDAREIYLAVAESFRTLFGEMKGAQAWVAVMEAEGDAAIFRYRRGMDSDIEAALAAVCSVGGVPAVIHPVLTSGTIRTLRERRKNSGTCPKKTGTVTIGGIRHPVEIASSGRIDCKEKGINPRIPLYITEEDIEDLNYDE